MAITENLETIINARYGREVRQAIHDGIKQAYDDAISNGHADMEVSQARGSYPTLGQRLDETTAQLARKANEQDVNQRLFLKRDKEDKIEPDDLSTEALALVTGTGTVDLNTIPQDFSVTNRKIHSSVRQLLNNKEVYGNMIEWEIGSVNNSGSLVTNNARIRTKEQVRVNKGVISLNDYTTYKLLVVEYDLNGVFVSYSDFINEDHVIFDDCFIKVIISRNDNTTITVDDIPSISSQLVIYTNANEIDGTKIKEKTIDFDKINFVKGLNLYNGLTTDFTISSNQISFNNELSKQFYVPIAKGEKYQIKIEGMHNRFIIDLSKSLTLGTTVDRISSHLGKRNYSELSFENTDEHNYLIVTVAYNLPEYNAEISVYDSEYLSINGEHILKAEKNSINGSFIKNESISREKLNFEPASYSDIYIKAPDSDKARATSAEVYQDYDSLIALNPTYASRNVLGVDAWGNELREYIFKTPDYNTYADNPRNQDSPITKPKILITTGIHGDEKTPVLAYYKFLKDMTENKPLGKWNELREAVEFRIIPVATPSAYTGNKRLNDNGVNINRNFNVDWVVGNEHGASPASELETQIIQAWLTEHSDALVYMDVHNTGYTTERVWLSAKNGTTYETYIKDSFRKTINSLSHHWRSSYGFPENVNLGYTGSFNFAGAQQYGDSLNIPSCISEIAWNVSTYTIDTGPFGDIAYAMAREFLGNFVMKLSKKYVE